MNETKPKMKVLKNEGPNGPIQVQQKGYPQPQPVKTVDENNAKAKDLEKQMMERQAALQKLRYTVKTTMPCLDYLIKDFYQNVRWEGYECYAISESYNELSKVAAKVKPTKTGKVSIKVKPEILEATFHFIKKHFGTGLDSAMNHRLLAEDFSVAMARLNEDRNGLREIAMEAEAAKHGISVEEYKNAAEIQQRAMQNGQQPKF